ncbi:MAG: hypothetical protein FJY97_11050 [candidate division Zixibacteria bacterium]|nr:hypothetical protein [candidate division Zixibacteria bacterium]
MKRLSMLVASCTAVLFMANAAPVFAQHDDPDMEWEMAEEEAPNLFARLGGQEKVATIVGDFVAMVMADDKLKKLFEKTDQMQWKKDLAGQIAKAAGGQTDFAGKSLKESLSTMHVSEEGIQGVTRQLAATLEKHKIAKTDGDALLVALELKKAEPAQP